MNLNNQPVKPVRVPPTRFDRVLDLVALFLIVLLWVLTIKFYIDAPEKVPTGYGTHEKGGRTHLDAEHEDQSESRGETGETGGNERDEREQWGAVTGYERFDRHFRGSTGGRVGEYRNVRVLGEV